MCISFVSPDVRLLRGSMGQREATLASVQMSILCLCVCRSAFLFHFVSVFQFSLCVSQFPLLWSCLCFMSCPWRLALSSPVGSTDTLSFCLLIKSRFWKGEEERRSRLKQMQQCSGDCEFCAVDEYNLQTADHVHVLSRSRCYSRSPESSRDRNTQVPRVHLSWDQQ